jgi:hypothetical protein
MRNHQPTTIATRSTRPRKAEPVSKDIAHLAYGIRQGRGAPHVCTSLSQFM